MKTIPKRSKFAILGISAVVAAAVYASNCSQRYSEMTAWQLEQKIDPDAQTGMTKLKAHIDSATYAGLAFCSCALALLLVKKISRK